MNQEITKVMGKRVDVWDLERARLVTEDYRENPILTGFNPDPAICKKGEDFYIAKLN